MVSCPITLESITDTQESKPNVKRPAGETPVDWGGGQPVGHKLVSPTGEFKKKASHDKEGEKQWIVGAAAATTRTKTGAAVHHDSTKSSLEGMTVDSLVQKEAVCARWMRRILYSTRGQIDDRG